MRNVIKCCLINNNTQICSHFFQTTPNECGNGKYNQNKNHLQLKNIKMQLSFFWNKTFLCLKFKKWEKISHFLAFFVFILNKQCIFNRHLTQFFSLFLTFSSLIGYGITNRNVENLNWICKPLCC